MHHGAFGHESPDDYDMDLDQRARMLSSRGGRVILLGDGSDYIDDPTEDSDMFDQSDDEEKDLESQVRKDQPDSADSERTLREETPGPEAAGGSSRKSAADALATDQVEDVSAVPEESAKSS